MVLNIVPYQSTSVDETARSAAASAQHAAVNAQSLAEAAQTAAITAESRAAAAEAAASSALAGGAHDQTARAALASMGAYTTNDWMIDTTPTEGVSAIIGVGWPHGSDIGKKSYAAGDPIIRWGSADDNSVLNAVDATVAPSSSKVGFVDMTLAGSAAIRVLWADGAAQRALGMVDHTTTPALNVGETLWVHVAKIRINGSNQEVTVHLTLDGALGAMYAAFGVDLTTGFVTQTEGPGKDYFTFPTEQTVTITDNGDGTYDFKMPLVPETAVNAGWSLGIRTRYADTAWVGDGSDNYIELTPPVVIPNSEDATWPATGPTVGWEVVDLTIGNHVDAVPVAIAATSVKSSEATTGALEIVATNTSGLGHCIVRLDITNTGEPQLYVTEDNGATVRRMTLPSDQWAADAEKEVTLALTERHRTVEAILAIDRVVVTGLPVGDTPVPTAYRVKLPATAACDSNGLAGLVDYGFRASIDTQEIDATTQLPGLNYVVLQAT